MLSLRLQFHNAQVAIDEGKVVDITQLSTCLCLLMFLSQNIPFSAFKATSTNGLVDTFTFILQYDPCLTYKYIVIDQNIPTYIKAACEVTNQKKKKAKPKQFISSLNTTNVKN